MKKTILFLIIIIFPRIIISQNVDTLEITPTGINGFLVKNFNNKSSKELYLSVKKWAEYNIYNADYSNHSDVEDEYLSFKIGKICRLSYEGSKKWVWDLSLETEIRFKNNKIRIDIGIAKMDGVGVVDDLSLVGGPIRMSIYNKKGELKNKGVYLKKTLDNCLNNFAEKIFDSIEGEVDYKKDDW